MLLFGPALSQVGVGAVQPVRAYGAERVDVVGFFQRLGAVLDVGRYDKSLAGVYHHLLAGYHKAKGAADNVGDLLAFVGVGGNLGSPLGNAVGPASHFGR